MSGCCWRPEDLDMADATFATPNLTTFARLDALGLQVTGQFLEGASAHLHRQGLFRSLSGAVDGEVLVERAGRVPCGLERSEPPQGGPREGVLETLVLLARLKTEVRAVQIGT